LGAIISFIYKKHPNISIFRHDDDLLLFLQKQNFEPEKRLTGELGFHFPFPEQLILALPPKRASERERETAHERVLPDGHETAPAKLRSD
jgi:hypothetical protein